MRTLPQRFKNYINKKAPPERISTKLGDCSFKEYMCNKGVLRCWFISPEGAFLLAVLLSVNKLAQKNRPQTSCTDLGLFYTDFDFEFQTSPCFRAKELYQKLFPFQPQSWVVAYFTYM
jgi:hypothetical protein